MDKKVTSFGTRALLRLYLIVFCGLILMALVAILLLVYVFQVIVINDIFLFGTRIANLPFLLFILIGFIAQLIDGTLGMGYGVSSTSLLIFIGMPPAIASASIHAAEIFTAGVSGLSHWRFKNIDRRLFALLALPGAIGAAAGAFFLTSFDGNRIKPFITAYLFLMGCRILFKAFQRGSTKRALNMRSNILLGLFGGFVDASGGGGWGPVVTTTLVGSGQNPRTTVGTVNASEFLVTLASSGVFMATIGLSHWKLIVALIIGGTLAAPMAAFLCHKIRTRWAMVLVGVLIISICSCTLLGLFF